MPQKNDNETEILEAIECTPLLADVPLEVRKEWLKGFVDSAGVVPAQFSYFSVRDESCP